MTERADHGATGAVETPAAPVADHGSGAYDLPSNPGFGVPSGSSPSGRVGLLPPLGITLIVLGLLVPAAVAFMAGTLRLPVYRVVLIGMTPFAVAAYLFRPVRRTWFQDGAVAFFYVWYEGALLSRYGLDAVEGVGADFLDMIVPFLAAKAWLDTRPKVEAFYRMWTIAIALLGPIAIAGAVLHFEPTAAFWSQLSGSFRFPEIMVRRGLWRLPMMFNHSIHWGLAAGTAFVFALALWRGLVWKAIVLAATFAATVSSVSSAGLGVAVIGGMLWAYNFVLTSLRQRWVLLAAVGVGAYVAIDLVSNRDPITVLMTRLTISGGTGYYRREIWKYGSKVVLDYPLAGVGYEHWQRPGWMVSSSVDHHFLAVAIRCGIPASVSFFVAFVSPLPRAAAALARSGRGDRVTQAYTFATASLLLAMMSVFLWSNAVVFLMLLMGSAEGAIGRRGR